MTQIPPESVMLARLIGVFIFICGLSALVKKKDWIEGVKRFSDNAAAVNFIALAELAAGLIIFALHPHFLSGWPIIITITGLLMIIESVLYLVFIPREIAVRMVMFFNRPPWYNVCGILSILLGSYLILMSTGLL